jgi:hypothetical protein
VKKFAKFRGPSHTTVAAYLSLFLVVTGGMAYAAVRIGTQQLRPGAVTTPKIRDGAVSASKIAPHAIGGEQVDTASFQGLVHGNGSMESHARNVPAVNLLPSPELLASIPGFGAVSLIYCGNWDGSAESDKMGIQVVSEAGGQPFAYVGHVTSANLPAGTKKPEFTDMAGGTLVNESGSLLNARTPGTEVVGGFGLSGQWDIQLSRGDDPSSETVHVQISAFNDSSNVNRNGQCHVSSMITRAP